MKELVKRELSKVLREKRGEKGWNQGKAAEKCGRSKRNYEKLENCENMPLLDTFINIVLMYDIDVEKFFKDLVAAGYSVDDRSCAPDKEK